MVKHCHTLIVSDAHIMNNVLLFSENRPTDNLYLNANFQKYEGANGYVYQNGTLF